MRKISQQTCSTQQSLRTRVRRCKVRRAYILPCLLCTCRRRQHVLDKRCYDAVQRVRFGYDRNYPRAQVEPRVLRFVEHAHDERVAQPNLVCANDLAHLLASKDRVEVNHRHV